MNLEKRNELIKNFFLNTCMPILGAKGAEYETPYEEANKNFSSLAELLNESKYQVWAVLFLKHVVAVLNEIEKHPQNPVSNGDCETLDEKIADIVNYALIFKTMLVEDEEDTDKQFLKFKKEHDENVSFIKLAKLFIRNSVYNEDENINEFKITNVDIVEVKCLFQELRELI